MLRSLIVVDVPGARDALHPGGWSHVWGVHPPGPSSGDHGHHSEHLWAVESGTTRLSDDMGG